MTGPVKERNARKRLHLAAGERRNTRFTLAAKRCAFPDGMLRIGMERGWMERVARTPSEKLPLFSSATREGCASEGIRYGA